MLLATCRRKRMSSLMRHRLRERKPAACAHLEHLDYLPFGDGLLFEWNPEFEAEVGDPD